MKKKILLFITEIAKIVANCIILPLYFIKFYHEVATFPGVDGDGQFIVVYRDYYYSIFYKLNREGLAFALWLAVAVSALSIILSALRIVIKDNKVLKIASHILFGISVIFFLVLLYISLQISYKN